MEREIPVSGAFLNVSSRVPSNRAPPPFKPSPLSPFRDGCSIPRAPFHVPQWGPYGKRCPSPEPFYPLSKDPSKGTLPPEPLSAISQSPLQVAQLSPHEERCPSSEPSFHNPGSPVKEPSLEALRSEPLQRERERETLFS
jgi:hypothetical protein